MSQCRWQIKPSPLVAPVGLTIFVICGPTTRSIVTGVFPIMLIWWSPLVCATIRLILEEFSFQKDPLIMDQPIKNHGVRVTLAAVGINLALGILYTWSVISKDIPQDWHWSEGDKSWPYAIACLIFSLMMVPAGRLQDRIGPRIVATIGGLLVGIGMILASYTTSFQGYILGFGILAGTGIGFGYASATPPAVKWFSSKRTGLIAGIVVSGFGLASVYAAPLTTWLIGGVSDAMKKNMDWAVDSVFMKWLIGGFGLPNAMLTLGIAFMIVVVGLSQLLVTPPAGFVPAGSVPKLAPGPNAKKEDFTPWEMLRTWQFYLLWFMYTCGAGAGLMVISKLSAIAKQQVSLDLGFLLVAALAVGNGAGRILAGVLSDKLGRKTTMFGCFVMQAVLVIILSLAKNDTFLANGLAMALLSALIGANYGANLSLFPSITKDYYGLKNFGVNYGLVFTAWGVGGFMLSLGAGKLYDIYHTFAYAYYGAATLLVLAAIVTFLVNPPRIAHHNN
jgi:MFS transporter, OFA family, oxalate/formate antiporter